MNYQAGDKVEYQGSPARITKVYKNGNVALERWIHGGFMQKPALWKERSVNPRSVKPMKARQRSH